MTRSARRARSLHQVLVPVAALALLGLFLPPALMRAKEGCGSLGRCSTGLRQLGLAAAAYADDKRFFPHVGQVRSFDGDWTTSDALRVYAALVHYGYLDSVDWLVCGSSHDRPSPTDVGRLPDRRTWTFGPPGAFNPEPERSVLGPLTTGGIQTSLLLSDQVSYGWTRRGMNCNTRGSALLGADRALQVPGTPPNATPGARGNHPDGWNVVRVDASVSFLEARFDRGDGATPFSYLGATGDKQDPALAMEWVGANPLRKRP
ncbi:MAG: hypothetical protein KDD82_06710 [Planctomycetes bacterium]|nr:hypothetical protein [Planctomycetota bacterium]